MFDTNDKIIKGHIFDGEDNQLANVIVKISKVVPENDDTATPPVVEDDEVNNTTTEPKVVAQSDRNADNRIVTSKRTVDESGESVSPRKKIFFTLIIILLPILTFLSAEAYVRFTRPYTDLWEVTGRSVTGLKPIAKWALVDPFSAFKGRPGHYRGRAKKTVNKHGFISTPDISVSKPKSTIRVLFLGGSSTAGTGTDLADKDTWPWQVAEHLKKNLSWKHIEFINGALGGYTTFESFGRLWSRIRFFSPDIIVVYHGWNELWHAESYQGDRILSWRTLSDGSWGFYRTKPTVLYKPYWFDHLIRPSHLLTEIRLQLSKRPEGEIRMSVSKNATPKALRNTYNKKGLEVFRTNLQLIENAASLFGAQLFVAKQATLIAPGLAEKDKKRCKYYYHGYDHDAHVDAFNHIYQIIKKEIDSEYIIDTTKLSGHSEYFHDHVHPTILGAQKIAEVIQNPLLSYLTQLEKFLTQIPTVVAQHQKEPKNRHVLTLLRQNRKELADYYLKMAPKKFNIELKATSKVYQLLLDSDIYNYPFTNEERNFVDNIMQEFKRFKEPKDPKYRQYLTVLTLYLREMIMVQKLMRL